MDKRLGIKGYEDIIEEVDTKIMRDPVQLQKMINLLDKQLAELDNEIRIAELELKHGSLKKSWEFDFHRNLIIYRERDPEGNLVLEHSRGFKPRDNFEIPKR